MEGINIVDTKMERTYNLYCDESCHLENDGKKFMFLGAVSCAYPQVRDLTKLIRELKDRHRFNVELKWTHASMSKLDFYLELLELFFNSDLQFRTIGIEKSQIRSDVKGASYDDFYYKMYYQLLNYMVDTRCHYNVYLDIKDSLSAIKVRRLREILNTKYGVFRRVQSIRSDESELMQLTDFIMGAISYEMNMVDNNGSLKIQ